MPLLLALAARHAPPAIAAALTLLGSAADPVLEVARSRTIPAPPDAVWAVVGGFCDIRLWHGQVHACAVSHQGGETVRSVEVRGVGTLVEAEHERDDHAMTYSYALLRGPWPVKQFRATLAVVPDGAGASVTWRATFRLRAACDEGAVGDIEGLFQAGLAGLAREVAR